ncbi:polyphosphate kinase 1 [candidate division KSB1 bacterium]|nr:polyphosphate kinase 1 [candidate division KSB1 bacterium]
MEQLFINKEISWLSFNERVLQEAADPTTPLIERIKFLGIFSSNLDEFFRVRVATLQRLVKLGKKAKKFIGHDPKSVLLLIQDIVIKQQRKFERIYELVIKELAKEKIFIINEKRLSEEQAESVKSYFQQEVRPRLIPIMIDQVGQFPELKDHAIYLATLLQENGNSRKNTLAFIEVPTQSLSRFLVLPQIGDRRFIILLDDIIRFGLSEIFRTSNFTARDAFTVKLTRDAELDIEDDISESYVKKVSKSLKQRKEGNPVRFVYDAKLPKKFLNLFIENLELNEEDTLIPGGRYHNFRDFMDFPNFGEQHLRYEKYPKLAHKDFDPQHKLMDVLKTKDVMLHFCYQSFNYVIDLLREAAIDPSVKSIKMTIYRVAKRSSVMNALINAAKNGKNVVAVLELQARFDEEANIFWGDKLQEEGVKVIFGVPGLKVHSKLCLITRKEGNKLTRFAVIGTGNFNEDTATIYSDHALFTADRRLTGEVDKIFEFFETNFKLSSFKYLLVAPFHLRKKIRKLIQNEISNARKGKEAYIILKLNNLVDSQIIEKLYEASEAGVKIKLIVRSMFSLVPGIEGRSENIEAFRIVDKFLEHTRIFVFCNDGDEKYYISSADLMPRNLDRRVEVTCPIYNKEIQYELRNFLEIQMRDNVKACVLNDKQDNRRRRTFANPKVRAQIEIYHFLKRRFDNSNYIAPVTES